MLSKSKKVNLKTEFELISGLPHDRVLEVMNEIFYNMKKTIPFLSTISINCFMDLFKNMKLQGYADTEQILAKGTIANTMYFVTIGKISTRLNILKK